MYDAAFSRVDTTKLNPLTNTRATLGIAGRVTSYRRPSFILSEGDCAKNRENG
jgi:hypothetical protein